MEKVILCLINTWSSMNINDNREMGCSILEMIRLDIEILLTVVFNDCNPPASITSSGISLVW